MKLKLFIVFLSFTLIQCTSKENTEVAEEGNSNTLSLKDKDLQIDGVKTGKLPILNIQQQLTVQGETELPSTQRAIVYSAHKGYIKKIVALPGQKIKSGQPLAIIYDEGIIQMQQDYLSTAARLEFLEQEVKRKYELLQSNLIAEKEYQKFKSEHDVESVTLEALKQRLILIGIPINSIRQQNLKSEFAVLSPIDGFLDKSLVNLGEIVNDNKPMFEIINSNEAHISLEIPANKIGQVKTGQLCEFWLPEARDKYKGKVFLIGKSVDRMKGTVQVDIHPEDKNQIPIVGTKVYAKLYFDSIMVPAIAKEELIKRGKNYYVILKNKNEWNLKKVETGVYNDKYVELKDTFLSDKEIVLEGAYYLLNE